MIPQKADADMADIQKRESAASSARRKKQAVIQQFLNLTKMVTNDKAGRSTQ